MKKNMKKKIKKYQMIQYTLLKMKWRIDRVFSNKCIGYSGAIVRILN